MIRFNMPKLRIYQQILICFGLIVTIPLLGVTFIINTVNQKALKKELSRFAHHTAEALYRDFGTEMFWQKQQGQMMARIMIGGLQEKQPFERTAGQILKLDTELHAVGIYDEQGQLIQAVYRDFQEVSPELRLSDALDEQFQPFRVMYFNTGDPLESPYYLRSTIALADESDQQVLPGISTVGAQAMERKPTYYVQQKNFRYLQNMVRTNHSLYDAFYIIDNDGMIIAGPTGIGRQLQLSPEDYEQFAAIQPGVTREYSSSSQTGEEPDPEGDADEGPPLKKVIVKMPDINWGIIIESPYHVKQRHIKRAETYTFLLAIGCLVVMLLLVLPYILGISRNFRQLIKGVKAIGEGNYYRRIRLISNYFTPYEIVYLTLEFNRMARKVADSWQTIQEANHQLAKLDEMKSNLIDTVSHELRTPLTSIKGYTSRLLRYDHSLDAETRVKSLKVVKQQADRLSRLVEDLLVIPDLETANLRVYPDQVTLLPLVENAVQFIQARYAGDGERQLAIAVEASIDDQVDVLADPDRLEQILLNLLDNAVKYAIADTPIVVRVGLDDAGASPTASMLAVTVENQCEPIQITDGHVLDELFEKFKRLDDSMIRTTRGSGLGLFITRGLVEAMGGRIGLAYQDGLFRSRFTIPAYTAREQAAEAKEPA